MRVLIALSLLLVPFVSAASAQSDDPDATPGEALFVVSGRGWGHGVGMSQWGAYGMAREGYDHEKILAHYYYGTKVGRAGTKQVRVLLAEGRRAVTLSSPVPFSVVDGDGETYRLAAGALALKPGLVVRTETGRVRATPPLLVRPGKTPLSFDGRLYRGQVEIAVERRFLRVVNALPLETYLQGVVAGEVPHTWPTEALRAQAVAARSYALATKVEGKPFDLYSDVRSQVYLGVAGEKPRTTDAVRATAGEVVLYGGRIATTYYFSSSGGRTASAADVFGFSVPYLVSRPDPWDAASPNHRWGPVLLGARTIQSKLDVDARVLDAATVPTASGHVRSLRLVTTDGVTIVPGSVVRAALGLRSTWITVGVLRLDQPRSTVVFGSALRLSGIARGVAAPTLAASADGEGWTSIGRVARSSTGEASLEVSPTRTTRYRIQAEGAGSPAILVQVAPRVQLRDPGEPKTLAGTVRPRLQGARVTIERRVGSAWNGVGATTVGADGAFRAGLNVVPGSYRARVPKTGTWAEGVTPVLVVTR